MRDTCRPIRAGAVAGLLALLGAPPILAAQPPTRWSAWSASPVALDGSTMTAPERELLGRCGSGDAGLHDTAQAVLAHRMHELSMPELDDIATMQRAAGEPHPWARAWLVSGRNLDPFSTTAKLDAWLGPPVPGLTRRCGVASGRAADGSRAIAVVTIEVLADLAPLPTRVRPGQWLSVEARLRVPATGGEVIVLGPSGTPRSVPTSFDGALLRARFAPEQEGVFAVQVMADVAGGPRPVLEATVFAGIDPPAEKGDLAAPGEDATDRALRDDDRLAIMIGAARRVAGLAQLERDPRLDAVARAHVMQMVSVRQLAHDAGDGDPSDRLREAGVDARCSGENVSHAATVALANRALWASPSHRSNLLRRSFDRVGIAVARDNLGDVWAVETFTGGR